MTKTIHSVLGANTDSSAPQSSLLRINVGLPSSLDSLSGEVKLSEISRLWSDHGPRAGVHQLLPQPPALRQDVKQLPTRVLTGGTTSQFSRNPPYTQKQYGYVTCMF